MRKWEAYSTLTSGLNILDPFLTVALFSGRFLADSEVSETFMWAFGRVGIVSEFLVSTFFFSFGKMLKILGIFLEGRRKLKFLYSNKMSIIILNFLLAFGTDQERLTDTEFLTDIEFFISGKVWAIRKSRIKLTPF